MIKYLLLNSFLLVSLNSAIGQRVVPEYYLQGKCKNLMKIKTVSDSIPSQFVFRRIIQYIKMSKPQLENSFHINPNRWRKNFIGSIYDDRVCPPEDVRNFDDAFYVKHHKITYNNSIKAKLDSKSIADQAGEFTLDEDYGIVFEQDTGRVISHVQKRYDIQTENYKELFENMIRKFHIQEDLKLKIIGSASPEGDLSYNDKLAKDRCVSGFNWIKQIYENLNNQTLDVSIDQNTLKLSGSDANKVQCIYVAESERYSNENINNDLFNYNRSVRFIFYD